MWEFFEYDNSDVVLFIDVLNVFNFLNRVVVLYNIRVLCLLIVIYVINIYREFVCFFIVGGQELRLFEGIIQGDLFVMSLYVISFQLFIM